jgi:hypothetical protein
MSARLWRPSPIAGAVSSPERVNVLGPIGKGPSARGSWVGWPYTRDRHGRQAGRVVRALASIPLPTVPDQASAGIQTRHDLRSDDLIVPVLVGAALALVDLASPAFPGSGAFLVLLVPVVVCTVLLGPRRGIAALVLGSLGALVLVPIRGHPWLSNPDDVARLLLYLTVGTGIIVAISALPREHHVPGDRPAAPRSPQLPPARPVRPGPIEPLTQRELDVLCLAAQGFNTDEVADRLYVSRNTV